ncbi:MAG: glycosyltransferase family 2 protein [Pseudomonadota bacterium]
MAKNQVTTRRLVSAEANDVTLLDAVESTVDGRRRVHLFFAQGVNAEFLTPQDGLEVVDSGSVGGAPWLICETEAASGPISMLFAGKRIEIEPAEAELAILEDRNCFLAIRNGESAEVVADWVTYHAQHHGLSGAVVFDREKPGRGRAFEKTLNRLIRKAKLDCRVVLVSAEIPLGDLDTPPENHPYCTPGAPGKDRMDVPPGDGFSSPLKQTLIYEVARHRFLAAARAVANIDVYDLMLETDTTIFEAAVTADTGVVRLGGRHVYPWRSRGKKPFGFADHLCMQFDAPSLRQRWCIAPQKASSSAIWRLVRVGNANFSDSGVFFFYRFMALRHHGSSVSKIVPKSSLVEDEPLMAFLRQRFDADPVRMPQISTDKVGSGRVCLITTMKNEGPFILEWIAYHRAIGVDDFLVYTNDCTDCTDTLLQKLQDKGILQHRNNPFKGTGLKPQHAALQAAEKEPIITDAKWVACTDVDEYINVKVGDGTLNALFTAVPDANMIAMTWRLFGNADVHDFDEDFIIGQFTQCAPELARKPHQAWGFKTIFQNIGLFKKMGVHRPKGLNPQLWEKINWVNGSGQPMPKETFRNAWRSTTSTYGYDLVQLNHYAVRSAESFLVKRDRGRVNHVDRDQGLAYWFRMNNNLEEETSITRMIPKAREEFDRLMSDPEIAALHNEAVKRHRSKIEELRATEKFSTFFKEITGDRMQKLSRLHTHFGANVFLNGPDCIPDDVIQKDPGEEFFFTVERGETQH